MNELEDYVIPPSFLRGGALRQFESANRSVGFLHLTLMIGLQKLLGCCVLKPPKGHPTSVDVSIPTKR